MAFEWKLASLESLTAKPYRSEVFWTSNRHSWFLENDLRQDNFLSLYLVAQYNDDAETIFFTRRDVKYEIVIRIGKDKFCQHISFNFTQKRRSYGWKKFASMATLLTASHTFGNNGIFIGVSIHIPGMTTLSKPFSNLATSAFFLSLFDRAQFSDVVIRASTGQVYAHKDLLTMQSDYFAALFRFEMNKTHSLNDDGKMVVEIVDFNYTAVYTMIWYIYTNSLDFRACPKVTPTEIFTHREIFEISDRYQVDGLRDAFKDIIIDSLTVHNVVEILFEYGYRFKVLRNACLDFFGDHFEEVIETGTLERVEWTDENYTQYAELMNEIVKT